MDMRTYEQITSIIADGRHATKCLTCNRVIFTEQDQDERENLIANGWVQFPHAWYCPTCYGSIILELKPAEMCAGCGRPIGDGEAHQVHGRHDPRCPNYTHAGDGEHIAECACEVLYHEECCPCCNDNNLREGRPV